METNQLDFFLGALSPSGFCGYYAQLVQDLDSDRTTLLKGGPGCGKSTLLRRVAQHLLEQNHIVERIHCSGDPDSLDAVVCKELRLYMADATPPHALEPNYPVAFENIISLYSSLDRDALSSHRKEIVDLCKRNKNTTERATRYITAAGSLLQDTARTAQCFTDLVKARAFGEALSRKHLPTLNAKGVEDIRLLSALTCKGLVFYENTLFAAADTVIALEDVYGCAAKHILQVLREHALAKGHSVVTCYCSMGPYEKIEHLIFPNLRLAFTTANEYHNVQEHIGRTIHCTRFCSKEGIAARKQRLRFNSKAIAELLAQAATLLQEAKLAHDALELYYKNATDFSLVDSIQMP